MGRNMLGALNSKGATGGNMMCARIIYGVMLGCASLVAMLLKYFAKDLVLNLPWFEFGCVDDGIEIGNTQLVCGGNQAVYRVCLGAALFFFIMMIGGPVSPPFHNGCWIVKFIMFPVIIGLSFFIPNQFFDGYYVVAVVFADVVVVVLVVVVVVLLVVTVVVVVEVLLLVVMVALVVTVDVVVEVFVVEGKLELYVIVVV